MQSEIKRGLAFILFQILAITAAALWWIPSWSIVQGVAVILFCFFSLYFLITFWRLLLKRMPPNGRTRTVKWMLSIGIVGMGMEWIAFCLVAAVIVTQFPFSPHFDHSQELSGNKTTLYIYNDGFLDPHMIVRQRIGWTPFTKKVDGFSSRAKDVQFEEDGDWIRWNGHAINLETGEVQWNY